MRVVPAEGARPKDAIDQQGPGIYRSCAVQGRFHEGLRQTGGALGCPVCVAWQRTQRSAGRYDRPRQPIEHSTREITTRKLSAGCLRAFLLLSLTKQASAPFLCEAKGGIRRCVLASLRYTFLIQLARRGELGSRHLRRLLHPVL